MWAGSFPLNILRSTVGIFGAVMRNLAIIPSLSEMSVILSATTDGCIKPSNKIMFVNIENICKGVQASQGRNNKLNSIAMHAGLRNVQNIYNIAST